MKIYSCNEDDCMFRIMYSKPNTVFKIGDTLEVTVSSSVTSPQRGDILILLHRTKWHECC